MLELPRWVDAPEAVVVLKLRSLQRSTLHRNILLQGREELLHRLLRADKVIAAEVFFALFTLTFHVFFLRFHTRLAVVIGVVGIIILTPNRLQISDIVAHHHTLSQSHRGSL